MENKTGTRLKKIFARAAIGLGIVALPASMDGPKETTSDLDHPNHEMLVNAMQDYVSPLSTNYTDPGTTELKKDERTVGWDEVLENYSRPYNYDKIYNGSLPERTGGTIAVQVETSYWPMQGLLLDRDTPPWSMLDRHGESAAAMMNEAADSIAGGDIEVHFINKDDKLNNWLLNPNSPEAKAIFGESDVVTLSMGYGAWGDQKYAYSAGNIDTAKEIAEADEFWANSDAIYVQSAGNDGDDTDIDLVRSHAILSARADAMLRVGEASYNEGGPFIESHSSPSSPAFVTTNPYQHGFAYPYVKEAELRDIIEDYYASEIPGTGKTGAEIFAQRLQDYADYGRYSGIREPYLAHPFFDEAEFEGKEILTREAEWMAKNPDSVRWAFTNAVVDIVPYMKNYMDADEDGFVSKLYGTSFSAPYAGGMMAAVSARFPQLNEYDVMAAALIASTPVERWARSSRYSSGYETVSYEDNGSGLPYNDRAGGFGMLDKDLLMQTAAKMAMMVNADWDQQSQHEKLESKYIFDTKPENGVYRFSVSKDMVAVQTSLALRFTDDAKIPDKITLINPQGGEIDVSPTRLYGSFDYSLAETIGHAGNTTKGIWQIKVPEGVELDEINITVNGVQRGSVIEKYIEKFGDKAPNGDTLPTLDKTKPQGSQWWEGKGLVIKNKPITPSR